MNRFKTFILSFFVLIACNIEAQEKSLLWEVSGNGLSEPSYIYGTVHIICTSDFAMKDKVVKAFDKSKKLVLEVDISDPNEIATIQRLMKSPKKLSDSLSSSEEQTLDSALKKHFHVSLDQVDNLHPAALESMMAIAAVTCADKKMYEMEFIQKAKQQNKKVDKLESMSEQFTYMENAFSAKDVVKHMQQVPQYGELFTQMIGHYKNEDLPALQAFASDTRFMTPAAQHWLLDVRNEKWSVKMPGMMKDGSTFFAVGAIHLLGEKGILELLKQKGYTVTPVLN